jgi:NAD(P)-dependent dehydrogenase (short-subunit alcohol dehydrogenase family)
MSAHIINVPQTIANYCASKAAVVHLTKALAMEWAKYGIRVNSISPGYIQTELIASLKDLLPIWSGKMPEGSRLGYPEDLVGAFVYFASDASVFATGSDLVIDGGYTIL